MNFPQCPARKRTCLSCDKLGYFQPVCNSRPTVHPDADHSSTSSSAATQTNTVIVLNMDGLHLAPEPRVVASVSMSPCLFLVDTGASVSLLSAEDLSNKFPGIRLAKSTFRLQNYSSEDIRQQLLHMQGNATVL